VKKIILLLIILLGNDIVAASPYQIETVIDELAMPYYMAVDDNFDLIVTINGALIRVHLSEGRQPEDDRYRVSEIADISPGPPAGVMLYGPDYVVVENITASLLRVTREGKVSVITDGLGYPDEFVRYGKDFIVSDVGGEEDTQVGNPRLLRVTPEGQLTIIASEGLGGPGALQILGNNMWVTDFILGRLLKVTFDGEVSVIAEGLGQPLGIKYDGQDFIIADFAFGSTDEGKDKGRLLRISKTGEVTVIAEGKSVGNPAGITLMGSDILFSDVVKGRIMKLKDYREQAHATYDSGTGKLHIPAVDVILNPFVDVPQVYEVDMEFIPFSKPSQFELTGATQVQ